MHSYPGTRKMIKWSTLVVIPILAIAWIASLSATTGVRVPRGWFIGVDGGRALAWRLWQDPNDPTEKFVLPEWRWVREPWYGDHSMRWWPEVHYDAPQIGTRNFFVALPLWMLMIVSLGSSGIAWAFDARAKRNALARLCPSCRYSLVGLPLDAPCPECGKRTNDALAPSTPS